MEPQLDDLSPSPIRLVIEEIFPGDNINQTLLRVDKFLKARVECVWLMDASSRSVAICRPNTVAAVINESDERWGKIDPRVFPSTIRELFGLSGSHDFVCEAITRILECYALRRGSGRVLRNDTNLLRTQHRHPVRSADVTFYDSGARKSDGRESNCQLPSLAVAINTPGEPMKRKIHAVAHYLQLGIPLVWQVNVEEQSVTVYKGKEIPRALDREEELTGNSVLPDFHCRVAEFFAVPGTREAAP